MRYFSLKRRFTMKRVGELSLLDSQAALLVSEGSERTLVISDLHIGWEIPLADEGIYVPSQTRRLLEKLKGIIISEKPDRLLVLGDVKHTFSKIETEEWRDVPMFFEEICSLVAKVQVVPGNHDGDIEALLPENVEILPSRGVIIGDVGFFHGHTWPFLKMLNCRNLVIGHVHPVVTFRDPMGFRITRQVWVKAPCNSRILAESMLRAHNVKVKKKRSVEDVLESLNISLNVNNIIIMPSFNNFLGGQAINDYGLAREQRFSGFIGPVLRSGSVDFENAEIYLLDGTFLGTINHLRRVKGV